MSEYFSIAPGEKKLFTFDWSEELPSTSPATTVSSVAYTITPTYSPRVLYDYTTSLSGTLSSVGLTGAVHGESYHVKASATLSNGEIVSKGIALKCIANN